MVEKLVTIKNRAGLHTRPAAGLVKLAAQFRSDVFLERDGFVINAKSIIGVMTLAAEQGSKLMLQAKGIDEDDALKKICEYFDSGFGEL